MSEMSHRSAVVLIVDRWGAGYAGAYGNTWIETPAVDRLASQGVLFEQALSDSPDLATLYRAYWQGIHAMQSREVDQPLLLDQLRRQEVRTVLLTDHQPLTEHPLAQGFDQAVLVPVESGDQPAEDVEQTHMAQLFAAAVEQVQQFRSPQLLWVHLQGLAGPWDAPYELRCRFVDEEDPDPPRLVEPPCRIDLEPPDPDELHGLVSCYAAQVLVLDELLDVLLASLDSLSDPPLVILAGARGFPLGEHGRIGAVEPALYSELLQVPCLLRLPGRQHALLRQQTLVQPTALYQTVRAWFEDKAALPAGLLEGLESSAPPAEVGPQMAVAVAGDQRVLRTASWLARLVTSPADPEQAACQLFLKPDDRWDVNDVADRRPDVVAAFRKYHQQLADTLDASGRWELPPVPETLLYHPT